MFVNSFAPSCICNELYTTTAQNIQTVLDGVKCKHSKYSYIIMHVGKVCSPANFIQIMKTNKSGKQMAGLRSANFCTHITIDQGTFTCQFSSKSSTSLTISRSKIRMKYICKCIREISVPLSNTTATGAYRYLEPAAHKHCGPIATCSVNMTTKTINTISTTNGENK